MQKKENGLLTTEDFHFRQERWKQHEKELEYIQSQFKPKLVQLQKMLIAKKQNDWVDYFKEGVQLMQRKKKFTQVISNINKSMQLDMCIESEMSKYSNKYNFEMVNNLKPSSEDQRENMKQCLESLLSGLKQTIAQEEKKMELKSKAQKIDFDDYYNKYDLLNSYRSKAKKLERALEQLESQHEKSEIRINSEKLISEMQSMKSKRLIPTETHIKQVKALEHEYQLHMEQLKVQQKFQQRIAEKVQKEKDKIGLNKEKAMTNFDDFQRYIKKCKSQVFAPLPEYESYTKKKNRKLRCNLKKTSLPDLSGHKPPQEKDLAKQLNNENSINNKVTSTTLHQQSVFPKFRNLTMNHLAADEKISPQYKSLLSPQTTYYESKGISEIIEQCNSVQRNVKEITRNCVKGIRRKNIKLRNLDQKLETVKVSNFLENKLILI